MSEEDIHIIDMRNAYYMGNFQMALNEAQKLSKTLSPEASVIRDSFVYRAYIAQKKFTVVLEEIPSGSTPLAPLRTLAEFFSAPSLQVRDKIVEKLEKRTSEGFDPTADVTLVIAAAMIFMYIGEYEKSLSILHQADNLECSALTIQSLLAYDRLDLAKKELKAMQDKDEDAILTQLATVWVDLYIGGEKYQEAYYIVQELIDKYGSTPLLFNLLAAIYLAQGKYTAADGVLQDALNLDPNNADTLINLFTNSHFIGKAPEISSHICHS
jgi:coatomer protein complex subunit epsilon